MNHNNNYNHHNNKDNNNHGLKIIIMTMIVIEIPQTGLALMGFSRYCPSSLDLTNFVVWSCRRVVCRLSLADSLESGNLPGLAGQSAVGPKVAGLGPASKN